MTDVRCPIQKDGVLAALADGQFKRLDEGEAERYNVSYTGYLWETDGYEVVCEHTPGGLEFSVLRGGHQWNWSLGGGEWVQVA